MKITELQAINPDLYNTDKFGNSPLWRSHAYGEFYDNLLVDKKNEKLNILEVGIYYGGSVKLFHNYLKNSNITGVDIVDNWKNGNISDFNRLTRHFFNAYDVNSLNNFPDIKFDIIVDDGPHTFDSQLFAINNFYDLLKPNGVLIIEDVPTRSLTNLLTLSKHKSNKFMVYNWVDKTGLDDDIILTIKKEL